jgi:uncharacterized protein YggE
MKRIHLVSIAALTLLVLTSGCVGALGSDAASTSNRSIDVSASGQAAAQADQAVVRVGVVAKGDDAETARERLATNVSTLRQGLTEAGVDAGQITTSGYDIGQEYRPPQERDQPRRYAASQSFAITLNDTDRAGTVIDAAVRNGATDINSVEFTLSTERRDELKQDALEDATSRARSKAATLAAASNMTVVEATTVEETDFGHGPVYERATEAASTGSDTTIDSGPVTVTATVHVEYRTR